MRVLVTGGLGFIGYAVARRLIEGGHDVAVLTRAEIAEHATPVGATVLQADVRDRDRLRAVVAADPFEGVCHLAGRMRVRESFTDPVGYYDTNLTGTLNLLAALADQTKQTGRPGRIVAASTALVYGASDGRPISEDHPTAPSSPYGASKLAAEHILGYQAATGRLGAVSLRMFSAAGAVGLHGDTDFSRIIPKALRVAAGLEPQVDVNGDGSAIREFTHVADVADAYLLALDAVQPGEHRIYNVGSGHGITVGEVLQIVQAVTGRSVRVVHRPAADEPAALLADIRRIRAALGWAPARSSIDRIVADAWKVVLAELAAR